MNENRKYRLVVACELAWIALLIAGHITETSFLSLTNLTLGGYLAANVIQKRITNGKV
jgi:hypothetical protein